MSRPFSDADVFRAIADPTRRRIIDVLRKQPHTPAEIAELVSRSPATVSEHLRVLRSTGVIVQRREGVRRTYRLRPQALARARRWLDQAA